MCKNGKGGVSGCVALSGGVRAAAGPGRYRPKMLYFKGIGCVNVREIVAERYTIHPNSRTLYRPNTTYLRTTRQLGAVDTT